MIMIERSARALADSLGYDYEAQKYRMNSAVCAALDCLRDDLPDSVTEVAARQAPDVRGGRPFSNADASSVFACVLTSIIMGADANDPA